MIDVFAYDLNETDILQLLLKLAKLGRVRLILDNSKDHHDKQNSKPEDQFAKLFTKAAGSKQLLQRGMFKRYAHDKVIIVYKDKTRKTPLQVLTGSTNFSATGLYVNSNHVLVYNDREVAGWYASVFAEVWQTQVKLAPFVQSNWSLKTFSSSAKATPTTDFTFAPHNSATTAKVLKTVTDRIAAEGKKSKVEGSVLFAVMQIGTPKRKKTSAKNAAGRKAAVANPVYFALNNLHKNQRIFSYGISDSPDGIALYPLDKKTGVLVTGKPHRPSYRRPSIRSPLSRALATRFTTSSSFAASIRPTRWCSAAPRTCRPVARRATATTSSPFTTRTSPPCLPSRPYCWSIISISSTGCPRPIRQRARVKGTAKPRPRVRWPRKLRPP